MTIPYVDMQCHFGALFTLMCQKQTWKGSKFLIQVVSNIYLPLPTFTAPLQSVFSETLSAQSENGMLSGEVVKLQSLGWYISVDSGDEVWNRVSALKYTV